MIKTAKILRYLKEQDTTSADIVRVFGLKMNDAGNRLRVLHKAGLIEQYGVKASLNGRSGPRLKIWRAVGVIRPFRWHDQEEI